MISGGSGPGTATDADKDLRTGADITDEQRAALYLQVGDVVEVSSPTIGTLRNRIVSKR
jgi:2-keto-4-pentenoate hydratase/2-oxohepta-3-ene-1,7-dioic acid hydratase in catechol pathway